MYKAEVVIIASAVDDGVAAVDKTKQRQLNRLFYSECCHSEGNIDVNPVNPTSTSSRYERY